MRKIIPFLCLICLPMLAIASDQFPGIKKMMSAEELEASGLDKLSETELKTLNQWLIRYTANDASTIKREVQEVKDETNKGIKSQIAGMFVGWDGKTVFTLKNGQVWRQRLSGKWSTKLHEPEVIVAPNFFGFYELEIISAGRKIGVKRLK